MLLFRKEGLLKEGKVNIQKIAIAGAGTMGYSMAEIFAARGYEVTLYNHRASTLEKAKTKIAPETVNRIAYTTAMGEFAGKDLIVECIAENMDLKLAFYKELSEIVDD